MKRCYKCKQMLPDEAFSKNKTKKGGLNNYCRICHKAYRKSESYKAYQKSESYKAYRKSEARKARMKVYHKTYRRSERGRALRKHYAHTRRALQRGSIVVLTASEKAAILAIENECAELNVLMTEAGFEHGIDVGNRVNVFFHVDHIAPLSRGGRHRPDNLQILPAKINIGKAATLSTGA